jgi:hypothetical protein
MIHSGTLSYLNKVHREKYGVHQYWMKTLRRWSGNKYTVMFVKQDQEK